jgi:hypothetical protein
VPEAQSLSALVIEQLSSEDINHMPQCDDYSNTGLFVSPHDAGADENCAQETDPSIPAEAIANTESVRAQR